LLIFTRQLRLFRSKFVLLGHFSHVAVWILKMLLGDRQSTQPAVVKKGVVIGQLVTYCEFDER
jgi:hypothetical protein